MVTNFLYLKIFLTLLCIHYNPKKLNLPYFCLFKEKIAYMERVIQSSMFYNFYLFLSILLCNVDSALVSDSNAYI